MCHGQDYSHILRPLSHASGNVLLLLPTHVLRSTGDLLEGATTTILITPYNCRRAPLNYDTVSRVSGTEMLVQPDISGSLLRRSDHGRAMQPVRLQGTHSLQSK